MAIRYIPFGYEISDGEVKTREAEVVKNIFSLYIQGKSLKTIAERLNLLPISYAGDGRAWDKNIVKRILDNPKYAGGKDYPVIIPKETAEIALKCKSDKLTDIDEDDRIRVNAYHAKTKCSVCGGKMRRVRSSSGERKKNYWKCADPKCIGHKHVMNEIRLDNAIAGIFNEISDDLRIVEVDNLKEYAKNEIIVHKENAIDELITANAETTEIIEKMLELASEKFKRCKCGDTSAITGKIKRDMSVYPRSSKPDGKIICEIIQSIKISPDKTVNVELINGKEIQKENLSYQIK